MKKINDQTKYIAELTKLLKDEQLGEIDFDLLISQLEEMAISLDGISLLKDDHNLLRSDLITRMSGMIKAIAAVDQNMQSMKDSVAISNSLDELNAADLLNQYRRIQAQFKDAFPVSFGLLKNSNSSKNHHWQDFK